MAVKFIRVDQAMDAQQAKVEFKRELEMLKELRHTNVVQVFGWNCADKEFFFVRDHRK